MIVFSTKRLLLAFALLLLARATLAMAGIGHIDGCDEGTWTEDRISVVVGTIHDLRRETPRSQPIYTTFVPLATLAGSFDPSRHPSISVYFACGFAFSSIMEPPPDGATVLAVIQEMPPDGAGRERLPWIRPDVCAFMPDEGSSLVVIKGLGDPKVAETLKRIQVARGKLKSASRPSTRPSTTPARAK